MRKLRFATVLMAALLTGPGILAAQEAPVEGIQVHGQWTVEVWDGDALVERREFRNALTSEGAAQLLSVMAGAQSAGSWAIGLDAEHESSGGTVTCTRFEQHAEGGCFPMASGDQVTLPTTGDDAGALVVESTRSNDDGSMTISGVATGLHVCGSSVTPEACAMETPSWNLITERTLDTPVTATAGQEVRIQVVISLS